MPEGVAPYPRWEGPMRTGPMFMTVAAQEVRRSFTNFWSRLALTFILAFTIVYLGSLYSLGQDNATGVHTMDNFVEFLTRLQWGALAIAAVVGGPSLLEDARRGALELYLTRAVSRADYLIGKIVALFSLAFLALFLPALIYYGIAFFFFDQQPEHWNWVPLGAFVYALFWALLVAGLGLGLSAVGRSSRGATLILLGGFAILELVVGQLLADITKDSAFQILSPMAAVTQQTEWLFRVEAPFDFPAWWGLLEWAILVAIGWTLVALRHPRVRGEERVRA